MEENKRLEIIKKSHHSCIIKPWKHSYQSNHKRKLLAKPQSHFTIPYESSEERKRNPCAKSPHLSESTTATSLEDQVGTPCHQSIIRTNTTGHHSFMGGAMLRGNAD